MALEITLKNKATRTENVSCVVVTKISYAIVIFSGISLYQINAMIVTEAAHASARLRIKNVAGAMGVALFHDTRTTQASRVRQNT